MEQPVIVAFISLLHFFNSKFYLSQNLLMPAATPILPLLVSRFQSAKALADSTFSQLQQEDFFYQPNKQSNSIAIIIQHIYGNAMTRFTNFLTEDGEKHWRNRDAEFEAMDVSHQDLISFWNDAWTTVFNTLASLTEEDLDKTVYIRSEPHVAIDAIFRQLAHYSYHIGQIVYIGKLLKEDFASLSIPKGESRQFNEKMMSK